MNKIGLAQALCLLAALGSISPVLAKDEPLDMAVDGSLMVTRMGGVGTGLVLGPPVASVKCSVKCYKDWTPALADKVGGKLGGKDSGPVVGLVSLVTLPASLACGTGQGIYYGTKNAFTHGFNEPFSPASFSLSKLEE
ncbi:MAG: hypothetical protein HY711_09715 [Candidatus Melainabacteria bacterium]|nr:hypothetical protein [Candidatus Melainabacteria bacterium]